MATRICEATRVGKRRVDGITLMKTKLMPCATLIGVATLGLVLVQGPLTVRAQGMPPENRKNIHALFTNHDKVKRTVEKTEKGYVATTESDDPAVAAALREHVKQMGSRLESGLMVRRWDPAFAEYVAHYKDIKHKVSKTKTGIRITVIGKTPEAIRVARNHAAVISEFVQDGWKAHDRSHPAALEAKPDKTPTAPVSAPPACCLKGGSGACCVRRSAK